MNQAAKRRIPAFSISIALIYTKMGGEWMKMFMIMNMIEMIRNVMTHKMMVSLMTDKIQTKSQIFTS